MNLIDKGTVMRIALDVVDLANEIVITNENHPMKNELISRILTLTDVCNQVIAEKEQNANR